MAYLIFDIYLENPSMFTALEGEPNSAVSYDFIPGSAIRGMFIGAWIGTEGQFELDADTPQIEDIMTYFFEDDTRYLNAYPLIDGEQPTRPVPMTWQKDKYSASHNYWVKDSIIKNKDKNDDNTFTKPKRVDGFTTVNEDHRYITAPDRLLNVHTTRARRSATEQQVFRYDALEKGQWFRAVVLCEDKDVADTLQNMLFGEDSTVVKSLGGVQNAGYGQVKIGNPQVQNAVYASAPSTSNTLIITLLSDMILRDANGRYHPTPEALCYALETDFGLNATVKIEPSGGENTETDKNTKKPPPAITDTTVVGGFNRKWGLPLPQTPALKRGSVIKLDFEVAPDIDTLNTILNEGIGERCNDGFGQIAINWHTVSEFTVLKANQTVEQGDADAELDNHSKRMWRRLGRRIRQKRSEDTIAQAVYDNKNLIIEHSTNAQLSRLRRVVKNALNQPKPSFEPLEKYLEHIHGKAGDKALERARVGDTNLRQWLRDFLKPSKRVKADLLWIDAVLHRSIKAETEKKRRGENGQGASND